LKFLYFAILSTEGLEIEFLWSNCLVFRDTSMP
jgi:hypothetical protein